MLLYKYSKHQTNIKLILNKKKGMVRIMRIVNYIVKSKSGRVITKGICPDTTKFEKVKEIYGGTSFIVEEVKNA